MCDLNDSHTVHLINDNNNTDVIDCTTSEDNNLDLFEDCDVDNRSFFICEINTTKTGKYNLQINNNDTIVYKNNNVINIYNIESIEFFNETCLDFNIPIIKNFAKVLFDHKIKISHINKTSLTEDHSGYFLEINAYKQNYTDGTFEVLFDLILDQSKNETLDESMNYTFTINLMNSENYVSNYNFSLEGKNITHFEINNTIIDDSENSNSTNSTGVKFIGVGSNKIIISETDDQIYGTLKLIFNHNISNYSVTNFRAKSLPFISVDTPFYFENYRNDTRNPRYYYYYYVYGNYSGTSKLEFQICGVHHETIPLKFIMNVDDDNRNHCLYIQLKMPFFIFLFLLFI